VVNIKIEWLTDYYDNCETCGSSYAEGARVFVDGVMALDLAPSAHCFGGEHYPQEDVYERILQHLGHTVEHA
jgi:hypothetical protein